MENLKKKSYLHKRKLVIQKKKRERGRKKIVSTKRNINKVYKNNLATRRKHHP